MYNYDECVKNSMELKKSIKKSIGARHCLLTESCFLWLGNDYGVLKFLEVLYLSKIPINSIYFALKEIKKNV